MGAPPAGPASREQGYLDGLVATAGAVAAGATSGDEVVDWSGPNSSRCCPWTPSRSTGHRLGLPTLAEDGTLTGWAPRRRDRRGLPTDTRVALPVRHGGAVFGHFVVTASTRVVRPTRNQLRVAAMLADQAGAALAAESRARDRSPVRIGPDRPGRTRIGPGRGEASRAGRYR